MPGPSTFPAEVSHVSLHGLWLLVGDEELLLPFEQFPWFRVAPYEVARRFSFESNPRRLHDECGGRLPFGCHKWMENDRGFWGGHMPRSATGLASDAVS